MIKRISIFALVWLGAALRPAVAGEAEVHLYCLSLRFQPAATKSLSLNYNLELTSDSPTNTELNGEVTPLPAGAPSSHGSFYRLTGDIFFEPIYGTFLLNVPDATDANTNGVPDFFEISQAVAATTTNGAFDDATQTGKVTTTWSRNADSTNGTCRLTMAGYDLTFVHTFELQEYRGTLKYSSASTNVTGTMTLTNAAAAKQTLSGPVLLEKVSSNQLKLEAGAWTNETKQSVAFEGSPALDRDGKDYYDFFIFKDGDLSTVEEDYFLWLIKITDPNDADQNGIPDLSDEPAPRRPTLKISQSSTNLLLSISGEVGEVHQVEQTAVLSPPKWALATSFILTNDPQTVRLSVPTNGISFWRVKVP